MDLVRCPNCGTGLPANAKFCFECGRGLASVNVGSVPAGEPRLAPGRDAVISESAKSVADLFDLAEQVTSFGRGTLDPSDIDEIDARIQAYADLYSQLLDRTLVGDGNSVVRTAMIALEPYWHANLAELMARTRWSTETTVPGNPESQLGREARQGWAELCANGPTAVALSFTLLDADECAAVTGIPLLRQWLSYRFARTFGEAFVHTALWRTHQDDLRAALSQCGTAERALLEAALADALQAASDVASTDGELPPPLQHAEDVRRLVNNATTGRLSRDDLWSARQFLYTFGFIDIAMSETEQSQVKVTLALLSDSIDFLDQTRHRWVSAPGAADIPALERAWNAFRDGGVEQFLESTGEAPQIREALHELPGLEAELFRSIGGILILGLYFQRMWNEGEALRQRAADIGVLTKRIGAQRVGELLVDVAREHDIDAEAPARENPDLASGASSPKRLRLMTMLEGINTTADRWLDQAREAAVVDASIADALSKEAAALIDAEHEARRALSDCAFDELEDELLELDDEQDVFEYIAAKPDGFLPEAARSLRRIDKLRQVSDHANKLRRQVGVGASLRFYEEGKASAIAAWDVLKIGGIDDYIDRFAEDARWWAEVKTFPALSRAVCFEAVYHLVKYLMNDTEWNYQFMRFFTDAEQFPSEGGLNGVVDAAIDAAAKDHPRCLSASAFRARLRELIVSGKLDATATEQDYEYIAKRLISDLGGGAFRIDDAYLSRLMKEQAANAVAAVPDVPPRHAATPNVASTAYTQHGDHPAHVVWEHCEIDVEAKGGGLRGALGNAFGFYQAEFVAKATGPRGRYRAASSGLFPHRGINEWEGKDYGEEPLSYLTDRLIAEGWEPTSPGRYWYNLRFRRQVR